MLFLALAAFALPCSVKAQNAAGLVAAYNFDEGAGSTAADSSGNDNVATLAGAIWTTGGKNGGALSFNGTNAVATVAGSPSLDLTAAVTVEAWVKLNSNSNWRTVAIKEKQDGLCYGLYANSSSNRPVGVVHTNSDINLQGTSRLQTNRWYHLAMTYNGASLSIYVGGVRVRNSNVQGSLPSSSGVLSIGGNGVWGEFFSGLIDDLRIYNRALTATEIQTDMNTPVSRPSPLTGVTLSPTTVALNQATGTQQLILTATYADGTASDVSANGQTTYVSSSTTVVMVSSTGLLTPVGNGTASVTASFGGFSAASSITVTLPAVVLTGITATPNPVSLTGLGSTQQLAVTASYSNGSTSTVTTASGTTYVSSNIGVATVNAAGRLTAVGAGSTSVTVSYFGYTSQVNVIVTSLPTSVSGLVAAYNFNEGTGSTVTDSSGNNNTGTVANATWSSTGRFGGSLWFNGTNALVTVNHSPSLALNNAVTLSAWVYPRGPNGWQTAVLKERPSDLTYALYVNTNENQPAGSFTVNGQNVLINHAAQDVQIPSYKWSHLATTFNGSVARLFVNGVEVASRPLPGSLPSSTRPLRIGGNMIWGEYFSGYIDEVRVYDRALTAAEVNAAMLDPIAAPALTSMNVSPASATLTGPGTLQQLTVSGVNIIGAISDITRNTGVTYASSNPAVATVSSTGLVRAIADGEATISVSYGNMSKPAAIIVNTATDPAVMGQWSQPLQLGVVAVNLVLLRTGKVLLYGGQLTSGKDARLYDPATGVSVAIPNNVTDLFCSGHATLPDGRVLVVGGHDATNNIVGVADVNIFDPITESWKPAPKMAYRRWYPSAVVLPNGKVLVTSGNQTCYGYECLAGYPELYDPTTNSWTTLTGGYLPFWYYPFTFVLPNGRVLLAGSSEQPTVTRTFDVASQTWTTIDPIPVDGASAVMYAPGRVMKSGTASNAGVPNIPAGNTTYVLDAMASSPKWRQTAPMAAPRAYHTLIMLPDGTALAVGGQSTLDGISASSAVLQAELWSPSNETWRTVAQGPTPRLYHSTAMLMPDGRVLVAGGGSVFPAVDYTTGEYYSPPYLFKGPRPTAVSVPPSIQYGSTFQIQTPDASSISSVVLIRPAAVTHQFNEDPTFLTLSFTANAGTLTVNAPSAPALAPPGYYMLFIVNNAGVPSVAPFVKVQ